MKKGGANRKIFWIFGFVLWAIVCWWFILPPSQSIVEQCFSLHWYRWILSWITPVTQLFRFPVIIILMAALIIILSFLWFSAWKRGGGKEAAAQGFRNLFLITPLLLVWFISFWGAGYHRTPVVKRLALDTSDMTDIEAAKLQLLLLQTIQRDLTPVQERNVDRAIVSISAAMARTVARWDFRTIRLPYRVKAAPKGWLLFGGVSGVCSPLTLEPIVDGGLPDTSFVYTSAHELGHVAGLCAEDEATFLGYVAGLQADDRYARYSCALDAYRNLIRRFNERELRSAMNALPDLARKDLIRTDEAYQKYRIELVDRIGWRAYDKYLQAQGIREGVKSYSRGILLLSYGWRKGLVPLAR